MAVYCRLHLFITYIDLIYTMYPFEIIATGFLGKCMQSVCYLRRNQLVAAETLLQPLPPPPPLLPPSPSLPPCPALAPASGVTVPSSFQPTGTSPYCNARCRVVEVEKLAGRQKVKEGLSAGLHTKKRERRMLARAATRCSEGALDAAASNGEADNESHLLLQGVHHVRNLVVR